MTSRHLTSLRRAALQSLTLTVPMLLALAALLAWGGHEVSLTTDVSAPLNPDVEIAQWAQELIDPQLAELGCDTRSRLSPKVAVRPAQASPSQRAHGHWVFDTAVVTVVTYDEADALAKAGKVWVVGWCG